jgi:molybdopterin-guanine dinucleotide biosynthesis protein A
MPTPTEDESQSLSTCSGVSGIILAGGKSSRYGSNKALVKVNGARLIERAVAAMKTVFEQVILVTNTPDDYAFLELPMVQDLIKGLGPIGGIYTGLETISEKAGFFVACDMPFLQEGLLRHMVDVREDFDAVIPRMDWMIEPLHALYTKNCLPVIQASIEAHEYQIVKCLQQLRVRYVEREELLAFDPKLLSFFNINEPKDLP